MRTMDQGLEDLLEVVVWQVVIYPRGVHLFEYPLAELHLRGLILHPRAKLHLSWVSVERRRSHRAQAMNWGWGLAVVERGGWRRKSRLDEIGRAHV